MAEKQKNLEEAFEELNNIISKIPKTIGLKLVKIISIFLIFDLALTNAAVIRGKEFDKGNPPNNKFEEIGKFVENPKILNDIINKGNQVEIVVAKRKYQKGEYVSETIEEIIDTIIEKTG